ncbi:MAG: Rpn family recombination-promoting nuclease/putative transposase, partial [Synergistaceae bacterium]|nr:Rpn family recombination-promoting nuclease/putative transposase [Synergistaceae bacterium]
MERLNGDLSFESLSPEARREYERRKKDNTLPKEIDRRRDRYFKFLFGEPEHKPLLLDLLNTVLRVRNYETLTDIELTDRELSPDIIGGKGVRLDLVGRSENGRTVDLELQRSGDRDFIKRALYNSGTIIHR